MFPPFDGNISRQTAGAKDCSEKAESAYFQHEERRSHVTHISTLSVHLAQFSSVKVERQQDADFVGPGR
jgi:hypothetical protein